MEVKCKTRPPKGKVETKSKRRTTVKRRWKTVMKFEEDCTTPNVDLVLKCSNERDTLPCADA